MRTVFNSKNIIVLSIVAAFAMLFSTGARADAPGKHPAYLNALTDLRDARRHLEHHERGKGEVKWDEKKAIKFIDAAIGDIKAAAFDDGKDLEAREPVDAKLEWGGRLHRALELVKKAHADINEEEDNYGAKGLKRKALKNIDAAANFIEQGIANNKY